MLLFTKSLVAFFDELVAFFSEGLLTLCVVLNMDFELVAFLEELVAFFKTLVAFFSAKPQGALRRIK